MHVACLLQKVNAFYKKERKIGAHDAGFNFRRIFIKDCDIGHDTGFLSKRGRYYILQSLSCIIESIKNSNLCQSWVVFSKVFMRIGVVDRLIRVSGSETLAASLTIYVIVCSTVSGEVRCFVDKCSTLWYSSSSTNLQTKLLQLT